VNFHFVLNSSKANKQRKEAQGKERDEGGRMEVLEIYLICGVFSKGKGKVLGQEGVN